MANNNNGEKALALFDEVRVLNIGQVQNMKDLDTLGMKLMPFMPPQAQIETPRNAVLYVASCQAKGIMPFHGPYAWEQNKKLYIQDPYDLVIKWAESQHDFIRVIKALDKPDKFGCDKDDLVSEAWIIEKKDIPLIKEYVDYGLFESVEEAKEALGVRRLGVVRVDEMFKTWKWGEVRGQKIFLERKDWEQISPPRGWTWRMVADKRALMNAIRMKFGSPSPDDLKELAGDPLMVNNVQTVEADWQYVTPDMQPEVAERTAATEAVAREAKEAAAERTPEESKEVLKENVAKLRGDPDEDLTAGRKKTKIDGPKEEKRVETDFIGAAFEILKQIGGSDEAHVTEGSDRYIIQQAYSEAGLGMPDWDKSVSEMFDELDEATKVEEETA